MIKQFLSVLFALALTLFTAAPSLGRTLAVYQSNGCVVALDPGHGGSDPGAVRGTVREKDWNWKIANRTADFLRQAGYTVVLSREENKNPGFDVRVGVAKAAKARLMVSIHINSTDDKHIASGIEAWYQGAKINSQAVESTRLAKILADTVAERSGLANRGTKIGQSPYSNSIPMALIELGYINNQSDRNLITSKPDLFAQSVADAISAFTGTACAAPADTSGSSISTTKTYLIASVNSGKVLDVVAGSTADGAQVAQWGEHGGSNQQWRFELVAGTSTTYRIRSVHTGKCLAVKEASLDDGAEVFQWTCNFTGQYDGNEKWKATALGGGRYTFEVQHSGKVLAVAESSFDNGARLIQWASLGIADQQWTLK